jgi:hypothetical protein
VYCFLFTLGYTVLLKSLVGVKKLYKQINGIMLDSVFDKLSISQLLLLLMLIVFPGLVSMRVYRLIFPAKVIEWQNAVFESSFWGTVNVLVASPLISVVLWCGAPLETLFVLLVFTAILLPIVWVRWISQIRCIKNFCLNPTPMAWDHYFSKKEYCFIIVHLKNGNLIGGYYGIHSYASSYPEKMSIYFEKSIYISTDGKFEGWVEDSNGIILDSDVFDYLEFLDINQ